MQTLTKFKLKGPVLVKVSGVVSSFLIVYLASLDLMKSQLGYFLLPYAIINAFGTFSASGFGIALLRFCSQEAGKYNDSRINHLFNVATLRVMAISVAIVLLLFVTSSLFSNNILEHAQASTYLELLLLGAPAMISVALNHLTSKFFQSQGHIKLALYFETTSINLILALLILLARLLSEINLETAATFILLTNAACILSLLIVTTLRVALMGTSADTSTSSTDLTRSAAPALASNGMAQLLAQIPHLIAAPTLDPEVMAELAVTNKISTVLLLVFVAAAGRIAPRSALLFRSNKADQVDSETRYLMRRVMTLTLPAAAIICVLSGQILSIFSVDSPDARNYLYILICAQLINISAGPVMILLNMSGHERQVKWVNMAAVLVSIIFCFAFIPTYAGFGVVLAQLIVLVFQNLACLYILNRKLGILPVFFLRATKID
jgi:O-antigen/teichoic acid export membrane protein